MGKGACDICGSSKRQQSSGGCLSCGGCFCNGPAATCNCCGGASGCCHCNTCGMPCFASHACAGLFELYIYFWMALLFMFIAGGVLILVVVGNFTQAGGQDTIVVICGLLPEIMVCIMIIVIMFMFCCGNYYDVQMWFFDITIRRTLMGLFGILCIVGIGIAAWRMNGYPADNWVATAIIIKNCIYGFFLIWAWIYDVQQQDHWITGKQYVVPAGHEHPATYYGKAAPGVAPVAAAPMGAAAVAHHQQPARVHQQPVQHHPVHIPPPQPAPVAQPVAQPYQQPVQQQPVAGYHHQPVQPAPQQQQQFGYNQPQAQPQQGGYGAPTYNTSPQQAPLPGHVAQQPAQQQAQQKPGLVGGIVGGITGGAKKVTTALFGPGQQQQQPQQQQQGQYQQQPAYGNQRQY